MNNLQTLNFEITKKCNLKCKHCGVECGYNKNDTIVDEVNIDIINDVLRDASNRGCKVLIIAGGEPFLSKNIWNTLDLANKYNLAVSILSNGLMIDEELCQKLSNYKNLKFVRMSLDYPSNSEMKEFRGSDNIVTKVIDSLQCLKKYDIASGIGMTLMPNNIRYIKDIAYIAYKNHAKFFRAIPVVPIGAAKDLNINEKFYITGLKEMMKVSRDYKISEFSYDLDNMINDVLTCCPAGDSSISLTSDGYVGICPMVDSKKKLGNVRTNSFKDLYKNLQNEKAILQGNLYESCTNCDIFHICKGGCIVEKTSHQFNDNEQICIKRVITAIKNDAEVNDLFNDYFGFAAMLSKASKNLNQSMCFRALPIWSIFF